MNGRAGCARVVNARPLLLLAVCLAAGIVLGRYLDIKWVYITVAAALSAAAVFMFRRRALMLACAAFLMLGGALSAFAYHVPYLNTGGGQTVTGIVYNQPYQNDYGSLVCLLEDARIDGQSCGNIRLYVPAETDLKTGDVVMAAADVQVPPGVRNPKGFDERLHLLTQGVHYKAYAQSAAVIGSRITPAGALTGIRSFFGNTIDNLFEPDVAPLVRGMLLGDRYGIDEHTVTAFKDSGMAHVLAVSGLHAGILIAAVYGLFGLLRIGRTQRLVVTLVFIAVYACAAGLTPSIVRAAIMAAVLLIGRHMGKQTDTLSNLSFAFLLSLLINPLDIFSVSFQLSFGAVFGLLTLSWQINRLLKKRLPASVSGAISASAGATAGTLPVTAAAFNRVSLLGVLANVIVLPLCSLAIVLSFLTVVTGLAIPQVGQLLGHIAAVVIRLMRAVITGIGVLPFAAADVASPPWYAVISCYALLFIASKYLLIKTKLKAMLSAALAAVVAVVMIVSVPAGLYIVFLDVGQGDAAFLRTAQGGIYAIDGGREQSADEVVRFAVRQGMLPDAAFVSHTDGDHFSGLVALYEAGLLSKVYCSYQEQAAVTAAMPNAQVVPLGAGDTVLLDDVTKAVVLYPYSDTQADANEASLVLRIEYEGKSILFTGDISGLVESQLFSTHEQVHIYKAAHHGSKFSSYRLPLLALKPKYSVISVGRNAYGHPHTLALRNLEDYSGLVLTTQHDYAIEFFINDTIRIHTYGGKQHDG